MQRKQKAFTQETKNQNNTHFYFFKDNKVYPIRDKKRTIDFDIKMPPIDIDNYEIVKAKLLYLVYNLSENNGLYNKQQQKILIDQVEHLINIIENDVTLSNKPYFLDSSPAERESKINANKILLLDVYHVINQPEINLSSYQEKLAARKKDTNSDKIIGILTAVGGLAMMAVGGFLMTVNPLFVLLLVAGMFVLVGGMKKIPEGMKPLENIGETSSKALKI